MLSSRSMLGQSQFSNGGSSPVTGNIDLMNMYKVINSIAPSNPGDLVNLSYFNSHVPSVTPFSTMIFVDCTNGNDSNNGSVISPVKTITQAISIANSGTTIFIIPGTYNENLIINKSNLNFLAQDSPYINNLTIINGYITFSGSSTTNIGFKNLVINGFTGTNTITIPSGLSFLEACFYKCTINITTENAVNFNVSDGLVFFIDTNIYGSIITSGDAPSGMAIVIGFGDGEANLSSVNVSHNDYTVFITGTMIITGTISISNNSWLYLIGNIQMNSPNSPALIFNGSGNMYLVGTNLFSFTTSSINAIDMTGFTGNYLFSNIIRDSTIDILNGTQITQNGYSIGMSLLDTRDELPIDRISTVSALTNQVLAYNGTNIEWATISSSGGFFVGDYKYSAQTSNHGGSMNVSWLLCQGNAISRTTYSSLFSIIGTNFGSGDGSTTFNLPNPQAQSVATIGSFSGLNTTSIGQRVGSNTTSITTSNMPSHNHAVTITDPGHNHGYTQPQSYQGAIGSSYYVANTTGYNGITSLQYTEISATTANVGSGTSFNIMNPTLYIGNLFIFSGIL